MRYAYAVELSSGKTPPLELSLSVPNTTSATIAESVPKAIGTTDVKDGIRSEVPHVDDV